MMSRSRFLEHRREPDRIADPEPDEPPEQQIVVQRLHQTST
ncbi:hypothetical protein RC1_0486 [Rhodospirillum centenum SW]|uniref:Uncharacterized protein n=1 Tax=Rhodospirillum centenum (strain ATCC 51521 / SW) TaxID=414684 RepID=B6IR37_RHOCS|nr:hypothetical protein RC1_0486 [Rhodospirillum centenum SW]